MNLEPITRKWGYINILYDLLKERTPEQSISHKEVPTMEEHTRFIQSNPYLVWYFIMDKREIVGSVYLTRQREIGIHIFNKFRQLGYGPKAVKMLMDKHPGRFLANINPANKPSVDMFKGLGFSLIQETYEINS